MTDLQHPEDTVKILIITRDEPFYVPKYLEKLVTKRYKDIVGAIILPDPSPHLNTYKLFRLLGIAGFAVHSAEFIFLKAMQLIEMTVPTRRNYSVRSLLRSRNINIIDNKMIGGNINSKKAIRTISRLEPDIILSVANSKILKKDLLSIPKLGCLNIHGSYLPKYKGVLAGFWALYHDEKDTGVTIHYMTEKIDDGKIINQRRVKISEDETVHSLYSKIARCASELIPEAVDLIENDEVQPKENKGNKYYLVPTLEDIKSFRKKGKRFR